MIFDGISDPCINSKAPKAETRGITTFRTCMHYTEDERSFAKVTKEFMLQQRAEACPNAAMHLSLAIPSSAVSGLD